MAGHTSLFSSNFPTPQASPAARPSLLFKHRRRKKLMFKNIIVYRIAPNWQMDLAQMEEALANAPFRECGATQEKSSGWVPPRGEAHGALAESVGGQRVLRFMSEAKQIPASVLARKVKEKAAQIERQTGRKPGKKEVKELKDEAQLDLLPVAFTKQASTWVWFDMATGLLVLDASSQGRADEIVSLLVEHLPGLSLELLDTQTSPQAAMAQWLKEQEGPEGFSIDSLAVVEDIESGKLHAKYPQLANHAHCFGPWCWVLTDVQRLAVPVPWRGEQGLFNVPFLSRRS